MNATCRNCHAEFLRGATAALAQMNTRGDAGDVVYNEIVQFIGADALIQQARRDGAMRWSGLSAYVREHRRTAALRVSDPLSDQGEPTA